MLYIFWFLHQTTTWTVVGDAISRLYIFWFLHQTTTVGRKIGRKRGLYIFWFLHQTTTRNLYSFVSSSCISFDSYIKPQPCYCLVVWVFGCISFDSYIKPQLLHKLYFILIVVYLLIPTSNHNSRIQPKNSGSVVYLLIPTSNHNCRSVLSLSHLLYIFWFLHQTTTWMTTTIRKHSLYIFWFLHQTTTIIWAKQFVKRCISFDSYIKPQRIFYCIRIICVVYLLIPTSNHNSRLGPIDVVKLYIFWFLHQTTTRLYSTFTAWWLYIFWFLHQTTT